MTHSSNRDELCSRGSSSEYTKFTSARRERELCFLVVRLIGRKDALETFKCWKCVIPVISAKVSPLRLGLAKKLSFPPTSSLCRKNLKSQKKKTLLMLSLYFVLLLANKVGQPSIELNFFQSFKVSYKINIPIDGKAKPGSYSTLFSLWVTDTGQENDPLSSKILPNMFQIVEKPFDSTAIFLSLANYSCKTPNFLISKANMDFFFCLCFFVIFAGIRWRHTFSLPWMATPEVHGVKISKIIWRFSRHLFSFPLSWTPCAKVSDSRRL